MELKKYNVTVLRFDMEKATTSGETFILPVDSPDEEHAVSAAMSNAIAFTTKMKGSSPLPLAFSCTAIEDRVG
jgi:hypothetical protein